MTWISWLRTPTALTPGPSLVYGEPSASPGQEQLPRGHSRDISKDFPADELWTEIFVIVIYQMISSDFSEVRERPV